MKKIGLYICLLICFSACENKRQVFKTVHLNAADIYWYRESYISNTRAFVTLENSGNIDTLINCNDGGITDLAVSKDTVIIKIFDLKNWVIYNKKTKAGKFMVICKDATYQEWLDHYHPGEKASR